MPGQPTAGAAPLLLSAPVQVTSHPNGMPHVRSTIKTMAKLAREGSVSYPIRNLATRITHHVPGRSPLRELRALYEWVRANIRYRFDPVGMEWVQSPARTVKERAGDCDDMATLIAALAGSLGHKWRFRTVGDTPTAQRHVQAQVWTGRQWLDLDPVLEPVQTTTAPPTGPGTFALAAPGAEHLWDSGGNMLSGPTSPRDRMLWSIVPYFQPAPPWPPYGGIQPPMPGHFPRTDPRYRSANAPGFEGGVSLAKVYHLPPNSVASAPGAVVLDGMGRRHRFGRRIRRFAKKVGKGMLVVADPTGTTAAAMAVHRRRKRKHKKTLFHGLSGPTTEAERELWNWIPYDPVTNGPAPNGQGLLLAYPPGFVDQATGLRGCGDAGELVPWNIDTLDGLGRRRRLRGFLRKVKRVGKKIAKGVKKVVKNPIFQAVATTVAQAIPGAGQAVLAAQAIAKGVKIAKAIAKGVKGVKKGVKIAKGIVHAGQRVKHAAHRLRGKLHKTGVKLALKPIHLNKAVALNKRTIKAALAKKAAKVGRNLLHAAVPTKGDPNAWKKPHPELQGRYPKNARQLFDAKAGVFRVFVPSAGLSASKVASLRARGGKAKHGHRLSGLGGIRPTISFSLGAVQSAQAARAPELVALARKAVQAVETFKRNHNGKPPAIHIPAVHAFQYAEKNLTIDGLYGTNTHAAISWYLQGQGVTIPAYAPGLRTQLTWSPPLAVLPPTAPTPQPPPPKPPASSSAAPVKPPAPVKPKPPAGASFPAPGGYTEIGAETNNPGLAPAGYTGPTAPPAPAVPGTPVQPGAPTGGAPKPPVPAAQAAMAESGEDEDQGVPDQGPAPALVPAGVLPGSPAAELAPGEQMAPGKPQAPVIDVWGPQIVDVTQPTGPAPVVVPPGLPALPVVPGPVPPIPIGPAPLPAPSSGGSGGSDAVLWAAIVYLWAKNRRRAA
jgi:hypothetical protein